MSQPEEHVWMYMCEMLPLPNMAWKDMDNGSFILHQLYKCKHCGWMEWRSVPVLYHMKGNGINHPLKDRTIAFTTTIVDAVKPEYCAIV